MRLPNTLKELRSFLGSCNWLRHLIPRFADISAPLRPLLKKGCFRTNYSAEQLQAFADSDWGVTRSTTGFVVMLAGAAILAVSRRQHCITMSSCEAELVALADLAIELLHIAEVV